MRFNKRTVRYALLAFKERLNDFRSPKNEKVIDFIQNLRGTDDEEFVFPDPDEIAKATQLTRTKVNEILRTLYEKLIRSLSEKKWVVKNVSCLLWLRVPTEELDDRRKKNAEYLEYLKSNDVFFDCQLPVVPRIGEEIRLDFLDGNARYTHGYVYNVVHEIRANEQTIVVYVHPWEKPYQRWIRQKEEYEEDERRRRWLEAEREREEKNATVIDSRPRNNSKRKQVDVLS